jgi:GxxExxY protein
MTAWRTVFELCDIVRETGFALHSYLKNGHQEKVYERGLAHRLRKLGLHVETQHPIDVYDEDGTPLGDFFADLIVEDVRVIELKAVRTTTDEHVAQLLGYLRSSRREHGLLVNFGAPRFFIKKYVMSEALSATGSPSLT